MTITPAPRRSSCRRWAAISPATTAFLVPSFLLSLVAASHGAAAPQEATELSHNVAETEDVLFDKSACEPGLHKVSVSDNLQAPDIFNVRWKTTAVEEDIVLEVYREWAPLGADRFYQLVLDNYYNCGAFFRVVPDFVVQFGIASDPDETSKWGDAILDDPVTQSNSLGTITYATGGKNTRTAQLFINLKDNASLDRQGFSPFGKVVSGMDVLTAIYNPTPGKSGGADQREYEEKGNDWILETYPEIDLIENTALFEGAVESENLAFAENENGVDSLKLEDSLAAGPRLMGSLLASFLLILLH